MTQGFHINFGALIGGSCCCFLFAAVAGFVIYKLFTGKKQAPDASLTNQPPGAPTAPPPRGNTVGRFAQYGNLISRVVDDGFYIYNEYLPPGSVVHYRFKQAGNWITRTVPYQPGPQGHFVHVGGAPADIQVVDVVPPAGAAAASDPGRTMITPNAPPMPPTILERNDDVPPPAAMNRNTGYPSAY